MPVTWITEVKIIVVMCSILQSPGGSTEVAETGARAVELCGQNSFDLIIMDLQMPVMDGYTATQRLRADRRFDALPIIALTAHAMVEEVERCAALGMNDHVTKPINPDKLYSALAKHLPSDAAA